MSESFTHERSIAELSGMPHLRTADHRAPVTLTPSLLWLFTVTAGVAVANLTFNQPLLPEIGRTFGVAGGQAGIVATVTQMGYAAGLLFLAPLGDVVKRRRLIPATLVAVAISLGAVASASSFAIVCIASFVVGLTTIAPQLVIPFAAGLSEPANRGRVVGHVMSGLLVGVLGGRVLSGFVGQLAGWRVMFGLASLLALGLAAVLAILLPRTAPPVTMTYTALLRSIWPLVRTQPVLREAALLGALFFASFSALWTTLAFGLKAPPLHYGSTVAGLFGLLGIAGALTAPVAGRFADRSSPRRAVAAATGLNAAAWLLMLAAGRTLVGLAAGVVLLDAGTQAAQVSNQSRIYALPADAHSRLNTVYMVAYFVGGSIGSVLGSVAWQAARWVGVCGVGLGLITMAGIVIAVGGRLPSHVADGIKEL
ncbi:MAG TPA: MFS transporter [Gemmatimonadaceae bacterium]|nr:MFS transporter [Gemmatimonadaceae bacterium]